MTKVETNDNSDDLPELRSPYPTGHNPIGWHHLDADLRIAAMKVKSASVPHATT